MPIIRYQRRLDQAPLVTPALEIRIRALRIGFDVDGWLALREKSLRHTAARGRAWTAADFRREFTSHRWFRPEHLWVAEPLSNPGELSLVGSVTLELRPNQGWAVIHWLLVAPEHRRAGIASNLLRLAESTAWQLGCPTMSLETLATWREACAFYLSQGYTPTSPHASAEDIQTKRAK